MSRVLLIDDDFAIAHSLGRALEVEGYEVKTAPTVAQGLATLQDQDFHVVVTDMQMPGTSGLELIKALHSTKPNLPVILMTGHHTTEVAIEATKSGAYDYLLKPIDVPDLLGLIEKAVANSKLTSEPIELGQSGSFKDAIIGRSRQMQVVYKQIGRIAAMPVTVLIRGESGTGKELVARAIYQHSERTKHPFIMVNCATMSEKLLESELFGHEQGAFPKAKTRRIGRFEQANHGTIVLDEIGDMSLATQANLLSVLQNKTIQRLGSQDAIDVDVRVIATSHQNLERAVQEKEFREDLYHRLNETVITLPALRDRREDIPDLVRFFIQRYGIELGLPHPTMPTSEAMTYLEQQNWPGNVRELQNVLRKALLLAHGHPITRPELEEALAQPHLHEASSDQTLRSFVAELLSQAKKGTLRNIQSLFIETGERELYTQAIQEARGDFGKASAWLGVSIPTVREKLLKYGIPLPHKAVLQSMPSLADGNPIIPEHTVHKLIARGGFGEVWLATHNTLGTLRAVKVIRRDKTGDGRHYELELKAIQTYEPISRRHPSLLPILQVGQDPQNAYFYYIMEVADDQVHGQDITLDKYHPRTLVSDLERPQKISLSEALAVGVAIADALMFLHEQDPPRVHRDLKPANIVYVKGEPKLADPGLVTLLNRSRISQPGTEWYMDKETHGKPQGDIYSLGVTLRDIFETRDDSREIPRSISCLNDQPDLRARFNKIVQKACANKEKRYQSARELYEALMALQRKLPQAIAASVLPNQESPISRDAGQQNSGVEPADTPAAWSTHHKPAKTRPSITAVVTTTAVLVGLVALIWGWHGVNAKPRPDQAKVARENHSLAGPSATERNPSLPIASTNQQEASGSGEPALPAVSSNLQPGVGQAKEICVFVSTEGVFVSDEDPSGETSGPCSDDGFLHIGHNQEGTRGGRCYYSVLQFDLSNSPTNATHAVLYLYCLTANGQPLCWDYREEPCDWPTTNRLVSKKLEPTVSHWGGAPVPAPTQGNWCTIDITEIYNSWQSGRLHNYGLELRPAGDSFTGFKISQTFNHFCGSQYAEDPLLRPKLVITPKQ